MKAQRSLLFALASIAVVAGLHLLPIYAGMPLEPIVLLTARWWAIGALCIYGFVARKLTTWILISMVIGLAIGFDFPAFGSNLEVFSKIFIQLIKTVIAPLLLSTLVVGIAGQSNAQSVGRMSAKAFTYFLIATSIALVIGLGAINLTKAGEGIVNKAAISAVVDMPASNLTATIDSVKGTYKLSLNGKEVTPPVAKVKQDWKQVVLHIFPENVAKMVYDGAVLQIVIFSLIFGFALRQVNEPHRVLMLGWLEALGEVMFKFTNIIMYFAPFAVGGAMAYTIGTMGFEVVGNLLKLLATLYMALIAFVLVVFIPVLLIFRIPIRKFFEAIYEPASLAFATASSEAAFPKAMTAMENFGVPRKIVSFVLPTGYSFNLDGSTLYLSLASIFCAQAAGMTMPWQTQLAMMGTLLLTSKGVAGVPRASLVILAGTVSQFNIPEWPIAVILGVDALMDMGRTCVNLMGNCLASAVVARWEGEFDPPE
ncbi:MAG: cation:dicarboxylase symporter family transporter [Bacteroidota bacterium]